MAGQQDPWQRDPGDRRGIVIAAAVTLAIVVIIVIAIGMIAGARNRTPWNSRAVIGSKI